METKSTQPRKEIFNDSFFIRKSIISDAVNSNDNQQAIQNMNAISDNTSNLYIAGNSANSEVGKVISIEHPKKNSFMKKFLRNPFVIAIAFVIANLFLVSTASAQITQPTAWTKAYDQVSGTATGTSFAIANGSNRILVVAISNNTSSSQQPGDPGTISYGGVTLTKATSNGGTNGRMHTYLYYLKDNAVMDNTSRPLNVTISGTTFLNMTVWYAVYAGVDQSPASYTNGNSLNNSDNNGPAQLSSTMAVNANEQAIYISSIYDNGSTTIPVYTINASWTSGGSNTGSASGMGWKIEVAKRSIPSSNINDAAATSGITPGGNNFRYAMSAMSLPPIPATITTGSISGSPFCAAATVTVPYTITGTFTAGNVFTAQLSNGAGSFTSPTSIGTVTSTSAGNITATIPSGQASGAGYRIRVVSSTPAITGSDNGTNLTINALPTITTSSSTTAVCFNAGSQTTSLTYSATTGTPTTYSITWNASPANSFVPVTNAALPASPITINIPAGTAAGTYTGNITVKNAGGCVSTATSFTLTVNAPPVATFDYTVPNSSTQYCQNLPSNPNPTIPNPSPHFTGGGTAGSFTASPSGLVFQSGGNPGQVDLALSSVGTYTVTNTIAASGGCPQVTATAQITILALPAATISYSASTYCTTASPQSVTITQPNGAIE